jgi:MarR family transcriptional regulator, organic hydroperoxide resistance regulator
MIPEAKATQALRTWFRLLRLETGVRTAMGEKLKQLDLSVPQLDVLSTLTENEGMSQQELAGRLYVTKGNISGLLDRMVEANLVERRSTAADRRSYAIYLTDAGRALMVRGMAIQAEFVNDTLGKLSEEQLSRFEELTIAARDLLRAKVGRRSID